MMSERSLDDDDAKLLWRQSARCGSPIDLARRYAGMLTSSHPEVDRLLANDPELLELARRAGSAALPHDPRLHARIIDELQRMGAIRQDVAAIERKRVAKPWTIWVRDWSAVAAGVAFCATIGLWAGREVGQAEADKRPNPPQTLLVFDDAGVQFDSFVSIDRSER